MYTIHYMLDLIDHNSIWLQTVSVRCFHPAVVTQSDIFTLSSSFTRFPAPSPLSAPQNTERLWLLWLSVHAKPYGRMSLYRWWRTGEVKINFQIGRFSDIHKISVAPLKMKPQYDHHRPNPHLRGCNLIQKPCCQLVAGRSVYSLWNVMQRQSGASFMLRSK